LNEQIKNEIWEWTKAIVLALILAFIVRLFIFATSIVEGTSMEPTLEDGERVLYNKMVYIVGEPDRGDIVIIQRPSKNYVKRVVGLPGDIVEVRNHTLYVNDKKVNQDYLNQEAITNTGNFSPVTIPDNNYFVMGDNRDISKDSRTGLGFVSTDEIIGRSELIISPINEWSWTR